MLVENDVVINNPPTKTTKYIQDVARIGLFNALTSYASKHGSNGRDKLLYTMNPVKIFAKVDIPIDALVLVPQVDLDHIRVLKKEKANTAGLQIEHELNVHGEEFEMCIAKPAVPKAAEVRELRSRGKFSFNPFFLVDITTDKKKANVAYYVDDCCDFKVPCYYNYRKILAHEPILMHVPPKNPAKKQKTV